MRRSNASPSSMKIRRTILAPEFELFRQLFEANGIAAVVADPGEFSRDGNRLLHRASRSTWFTTD
jgi:hypothetical protein